MAFANLSVSTKMHRANQIIADIGSNGLMKFYIGSIPASPDLAPGGGLLAALPLSSPAGVISMAVIGGVVAVSGTGGTDGAYAMVITPAVSDPGRGAVGLYTVVNGHLATIQISNNGSGYLVPPTFAGFGASGLTGVTVTPIMTAILVFNAIGSVTGVGNGVTGLVRLTTANGVGVLDMDVGTTNGFSVVMDNTFITTGGAVTCVADVLIEG